MIVGIYLPSNNTDHCEVLGAFAGGLQEHGVTIIPQLLEDFDQSEVFDAAVVYGVGKAAVPYSRYREIVRRTYHAAGRRVVVLERGYMKRDIYHAAGWDGLNGRADFINCDMPPDRFAELALPLRPYRTPRDGYVLLIGQVPWDASVQHHNHGEWLSMAAALIARSTNREIHFRPHPLAGDAISEVVGTVRSEGTLDAAIEDAHCVVTYSSNVAVDAVLSGRPVWVGDRGSMACQVANFDLSHIDSPNFPERHPWANSLAYAQWTIEEMVSGLAWEHLKSGLSMPVHRVPEAAGAPGGRDSAGPAPFTWSDNENNHRTH